MRDIHLHTIALEPARWTPARVSTPLASLLPAIESRGFRTLEIYEPHLSMAPDEAALPALFRQHDLKPVILSSYANLGPAATDAAAFKVLAEEITARVERFAFKQVRLFPGQRIDPGDEASIAVVQERIAELAQRMPATELLLETHDGSIADEPARIVRLLEELALPNVALLFQPTLFEREPSLAQFALQKQWIRHFHFQDRDASRELVLFGEGVVPWQEIIDEVPCLGRQCAASIEFVAAGVVPEGEFVLERALDAVEVDMARARTAGF